MGLIGRHLNLDLRQPDPQVVIVFGAVAWGQLFPKIKMSDARKQLIEKDGVLYGVTYEARFIHSHSGMPQLSSPIMNDVKWIVDMATKGVVTPTHQWTIGFAWDRGGWDLETNCLEYWNPDGRILTSVISDGGAECFNFETQEAVLENPDALVYGHNLKFDYNWWQSKFGPISAKPRDTNVGQYLLDDELPDNTLGFHTTRYLRWAWHKDDVDKSNLEAEPLNKVLRYNALDSRGSILVGQEQDKQLKAEGLWPIYTFLMDLIPAFSRVERRGVYIDQPWAMRVGRQVKLDQKRALRPFVKLGVNPESPKQLADHMYGTLGIKPLPWAGPVTKKEVLHSLSFSGLSNEQASFCDLLLDYRKNATLWKTYFRKWPEYTRHDGRIHTRYALAKGEFGGTTTGRTSSRNPNLQNIPARSDVRGCFAATPGYWWWDADYSQLELRCAADVSGDENMREAFHEGRDLHTAALAKLYDADYDELVSILANKGDNYALWKSRRLIIKRINFGIFYGIGSDRLARMCTLEGSPTSSLEAQEMIDEWLRTYGGVAEWIRATEDAAIADARVVSVTGQRRTLVGASRDHYQGQRRLRQGCNFPIQHMASTILTTAMLLTDEYFGTLTEPAYLLMNVHDQQSGECKGDKEEIGEAIRDIMVNQVPDEFERRFGHRIAVPLEIDMNTGERWS